MTISYQELDDEATVGAVLSVDDAVFFIEDRFFPEAAIVTVHYDDCEPPQKIGPVAYSVDDTVLSVKTSCPGAVRIPCVVHACVLTGGL